MKKFNLYCLLILVLCLIFCLISPVAQAKPFLVCLPQTGVDSYEIDLSGTVTTVLPDSSGTYGFKLDLSDLPNGTYNAKARAGNIWGWSDWSSSYGFSKEVCGTPEKIMITD